MADKNYLTGLNKSLVDNARYVNRWRPKIEELNDLSPAQAEALDELQSLLATCITLFPKPTVTP